MTLLDDINARLLALKYELRQFEEARDDALKSADDPSAAISRDEYRVIAAALEILAEEKRAEIAEKEQQWRLLPTKSTGD